MAEIQLFFNAAGNKSIQLLLTTTFCCTDNLFFLLLNVRKLAFALRKHGVTAKGFFQYQPEGDFLRCVTISVN